MLVTSTRYLVANLVIAEIPGWHHRLLGPVPHKARFYFVNWDFDRLLKIEIELKSHFVACFCLSHVSTSWKERYWLWVMGTLNRVSFFDNRVQKLTAHNLYAWLPFLLNTMYGNCISVSSTTKCFQYVNQRTRQIANFNTACSLNLEQGEV